MSQDVERNSPSVTRDGTKALFETLGSSNVIRLKTSGHAADRIACQQMKFVDENQLKAINAMAAYVAYNKHIEQSLVQVSVETRFGVDKVEKLPQKNYEETIRFLVDLCVEELLN
jgi:hypothetical protein